MQGPLAEDNHSGGSCVVAKECSIRGHAIRRYSVFYVHATRPVHTVRFGKESVYKGTFSVSGYLTLRVLTIRNTPILTLTLSSQWGKSRLLRSTSLVRLILVSLLVAYGPSS